MQEVRNSADRLVCYIDKSKKTVEIVVKGCKTTIRFLDNGTVEIMNADKAA